MTAPLGHPLRFDDLLSGERRVPERPDEAGPLQVRQRAEGLVEAGVPVVAVQLVQVDVVGAQTPQAGLDRSADPAW